MANCLSGDSPLDHRTNAMPHRHEALLEARLRLSELSAQVTIDALMQAAVDEAERLTDSHIGFFHAIDADQEHLTLIAWSTNTLAHYCRAQGAGLHYPISQAGVWVDCFHARQPVIHNDYAALTHAKGLPEGHAAVHREMVVPILRDGVVVAILGVGNKETAYTDDDVALVETLGSLITDLIARKTAEAALRESEARYRSLLEASPLAILVVQEGCYQYGNPAALAMLGYADAASLRGMPVLDTIHPDHHAAVLQRMTHLASGTPNPPIELHIQRPDGSTVHSESTSIPMTLNGQPAILIVGKDINKRKQAEAALRLQSLVLDQICDLVTITDLDGVITYLNQANYRTLQRTPDEMLGQSLAIFGDDPAEGASQQDIIDATLSHGEWRGEVVNFTADGTRIIMDCRTRLVHDEHGQPVALCGISTDITERKQAEQALQHAKTAAETASLVKSQFLATMSHEIRTPLTGVMGMVELLAGTVLSDEQRSYVELAQRSASMLLELLNNMIDLSRIEAGQLSIAPHHFPIRHCIDTTIGPLMPPARAKGLTLTATIDDAVPDHVIGDSIRLKQILVNLLTNAIKFTEAGEVALRVSLDASEEALLRVHFTVRDTGIGIAADDQQRIFTMFTQADTSIIRRYDGAGLGLAICSQVIQLMGGTIRVESALHAGSTFHVVLPFALAPAFAVYRSEADLTLGETTILVIDGDKIQRTHLSALLTGWQIPQYTCDTPEAAREWLDGGLPASLVIVYATVQVDTGRFDALADFVEGLPVRPPVLVLLPHWAPAVTADERTGSHITGILRTPFSPSELLDQLMLIQH